MEGDDLRALFWIAAGASIFCLGVGIACWVIIRRRRRHFYRGYPHHLAKWMKIHGGLK
jgi:hypothetical protein